MAFQINEIVKAIRNIYEPGSPYVPADPGQVYVPAYCETIERTVAGTGTGGTAYSCIDIPITDGSGNITGYTVVCFGGATIGGGTDPTFQSPTSPTTYTERVCYPAQPYIAPTPAQPAIASQLTIDYNLGWNAGAEGDEVLVDGKAFQFTVYPSSVGAALGVSDVFDAPSTHYAGMELCVMATKGTFAIMETGIVVVGYQPFNGDDVFRISLVDGRLFVTRNGSYVYDKAADTDTYKPDASFYSGGDGAYDGSIEAAYSDQGLANSTSKFPAAAVCHVPDYGTAESTTKFSGIAGAVEVDSAVYTRAESTTVFSASATTATETTAVSKSVFSGTANGHVGVDGELSFQPMEGVGYAPNLLNGSGYGSFEPMTGFGESGYVKPTIGVASLSFSPPIMYGHGWTGTVGSVDAAMEPMEMIASDYPYGSAVMEMQPMEGIGYEIPEFDGYLTATLPKITFDGYMSESPEYGVVKKLPQITFQGQFGSQLKVILPALSVSANMENEAMMRVDAALPRIGFTGTLYSGAILTMVRPLPAITGYGQFGSQMIATLPRLQGDASVTAGNVLRLQASLPAMTLESEVSQDGTIRLDAVLPSIEPLYGVLESSLPSLTFVGEIVATPAPFNVDNYEAYALNLSNDGMTRYTNYGFDFIVRFNGEYFGINPEGLYPLEGDDDNGENIKANITLPPDDYGTSRNKRLNNVYIGADSDSQLLVTATVDESRSATVQTAHAGRNRRAKIPKGLKGRYWGLKIENRNGKRFKIDSVESLPDVLRRKV